MNQDKKPWVSFCMSTFRRPVFLSNTLQTILRQTFTDFEVIVSDNDPEGSAGPVVRAINDPRIRYFHNGENLGMIKSFNKSIERSIAGFIVMITDDDPVYPDLLETFFRMHKQFPGYGMYLGGCDWFCTSHEVGRLYHFKVGTNSCLSNDHDIDHMQAYQPDEFLKQLFSFGIFPHYLWSTALVKREILVAADGIPDYGTPFLGDYAYIGTVASHSGCVIINRSLGCQTLHNENFGRKQNEQIAVAAENFPAYLEKKAGHLSEWPEIKKLMLRFTALWLVSHMSFLHAYYKKTGTYDKSLHAAEKAVFAIDYVRGYRMKYVIKKKFPALHALMVKWKKKLSSN